MDAKAKSKKIKFRFRKKTKQRMFRKESRDVKSDMIREKKKLKEWKEKKHRK